jgi:hypothetical protein
MPAPGHIRLETHTPDGRIEFDIAAGQSLVVPVSMQISPPFHVYALNTPAGCK